MFTRTEQAVLCAVELYRLKDGDAWNRDMVAAVVQELREYRSALEVRWAQDERARQFTFGLDQTLIAGLRRVVPGAPAAYEALHVALDEYLDRLEHLLAASVHRCDEVDELITFFVLLAQDMTAHEQEVWQASRGYRRFATA